MTTMSEDFAQVPSSSFDTQDISMQEDWVNQLQVLDLPQLFSFKDIPPTSSGLEDFDPAKEMDLNTLESLLDAVPLPSAQHDAPGPTRHAQTPKPKESKDTLLKSPPKIALLPRDELLKFSSEDLEAYVKVLSATRPLTTAENREIKKQRRLIKNRESAQQSRKRKKDKVGDLEAQVSQLESIHEERQAKLDELESESVILKAEVAQLVNVVKDSPALSSLLMNVTSWMVMYTLAKAINTNNVQQTLIPPIIQQKIQQFPMARVIC